MFLNQHEFCLYIEKQKRELKFDTYIETVLWFVETESDQDLEHVAKSLNRKIKEAIEIEASDRNMLKERLDLIQL